tara:strand:+ start:142 stop:273 length:132 start_codon:yes stop_codon:yes gene_type:complete
MLVKRDTYIELLDCSSFLDKKIKKDPKRGKKIIVDKIGKFILI